MFVYINNYNVDVVDDDMCDDTSLCPAQSVARQRKMYIN